MIRSRARSSSALIGAGRNRSSAARSDAADQPIGDLGDFVAAEDADDAGRSPGSSSSSRAPSRSGRQPATITPRVLPCPLELEHLADDGFRFLPRALDEAAGVDDDEIGPVRLGDERVAVERQRPEHLLAVDQVLGAAPG